MLIITEQAVDALKTLIDPGESGVRISLTVSSANGHRPGLTVEPAHGPQAEDEGDAFRFMVRE